MGKTPSRPVPGSVGVFMSSAYTPWAVSSSRDEVELVLGPCEGGEGPEPLCDGDGDEVKKHVKSSLSRFCPDNPTVPRPTPRVGFACALRSR